MTSKKCKLKRQKISNSKFNKILEYFCQDLTAFKTSQIIGVNRKTVDRYYNLFRLLIFENQLKQELDKFGGEVEIDESYFGPKRIRGKRGRGAKGKIPVIGLLKRNSKVYTKIVAKCDKKQLLPVIKGKILEESTVYTDGWKSYDGLVLNGYKHYRIYHSKDEFARGKNHINGIESFWSYTKRRLAKFNGIYKHYFLIYLKESEWRFNNRNNDLKKELKKLVKNIS
jgi:transposase